MSDVFMVDLFYFKIKKHITICCCTESTFYRYGRIYQTHSIDYIKQIHLFSILYNISIFSFLSLCVSEKYSIFIVNPVQSAKP